MNASVDQALSSAPVASDPAGGTDLYLDTTVNGVPKGLAHFILRGTELWAGKATLAELGFAVRADAPDVVRLGSLQGLTASYDAPHQAVTLNAPLELLKLGKTFLNSPENERPRASASPGLLLNYDLFGTHGEHGAGTANSFTELRAFNAEGVLSSTALSQAAGGAGWDWHNRVVRLDSSWTTSLPDRLITLIAGDTLTQVLSWSRATRMAGLQVGTNFSLQPYLYTAPLPAFVGSATLPSNVQLYVDGVSQYSGKTPPGQFQLDTIPNISGAGNAQVVMTDALGHSTIFNFSLYDEHQLLKRGLADWSVNAGFVRENYGLRSFEYGQAPVETGTFRYGLTDRLTLEAHAETTPRLFNGGGGFSMLLGSAGGIVSAAVARSDGSRHEGTLYSLGYSWRNERYNFAVNGIRTFGAYSDAASFYGQAPANVSVDAVAGYASNRAGSFGANFIALRNPQEQLTRFAGAYWFKSIGRSVSANLSFNQNLNNHSDRTAFLIVTVALTHSISASGSVSRVGNDTGYAFDASKSTPTEGGFGWRTSLRQGEGQSGGQGELDYLGRDGQIDAGFNATGDVRYGYLEGTGALVVMSGGLFAARHINDGFAVVSTDGMAGVPVTLENNPIGTTDRNGLLLITPLNSYQKNQISIDPMNLPADVRIDRMKALVTPSDRSGLTVRFAITPIRAASISLVDPNGQPLPLGSSVSVAGKPSATAIVGYDGSVYLESLEEHNILNVDTHTGFCRVEFDWPAGGKNIPVIGPLVCGPERGP